MHILGKSIHFLVHILLTITSSINVPLLKFFEFTSILRCYLISMLTTFTLVTLRFFVLSPKRRDISIVLICVKSSSALFLQISCILIAIGSIPMGGLDMTISCRNLIAKYFLRTGKLTVSQMAWVFGV